MPLINRDAPLWAREEVDIDAPIAVVWDVLTNVKDWARWNPAVQSAEMTGPVAPGTEFRWKAGPGTIESRMEVVEPPERLGWTGRTLGLSAIHVWTLKLRDGATHVTTLEFMEGRAARLLRGTIKKNLDTSLEKWVRGLKTESEARSA
jgi:uncharacterized protein YndB with AHSA1/START domain